MNFIDWGIHKRIIDTTDKHTNIQTDGLTDRLTDSEQTKSEIHSVFISRIIIECYVK